MQFIIETGVPVACNYRRYPFTKLKPGQSVFIPLATTEEKRRAAKSAYALTHNKGWTMVTKREANGLRVWRID